MTRWSDLLTALLAGRELDAADADWAMRHVMGGDASPALIAAFVVALRARGESAAEVAALAAVMLEYAEPLAVPTGLRTVDTCGTGGDQADTVNISTMAAFVLAGAGAAVVKHGNRAASSRCGSADLLEELGVAIDLPPSAVAASIAAGSPAFCFAPVFHPSMRYAGPTRRELGIPTVFNVLGPLTNPARPAAQVVGVADARLCPVVAGVFAERGTDALVVRGDDGLDELSTAAASRVWWVRNGAVSQVVLEPSRFGLTGGNLGGGDRAFNAAVCRELLSGEPGPVRDAVLLNAAAGWVAYAPAPGGLDAQLSAALERCARSIDSGAAAGALEQWVRVSQQVRAEGGAS